MSQIQVDNIYNKEGTGSPSFPLGANVTGVITATSFSGSGANLTGIDATALKDSNGTVRVQANTTGAVITGNVSVGGTLTYEDVTNVDAVGIITARSGIKVTGGDIDVTSGNIKVGTATTIDNSGVNITGVVTATSYRGDGSQLSGIEAAPTIQAVANGAIAANKPVRLNEDGTISEIKNTTISAGTGSNTDIPHRAGYTPQGGDVAWISATKFVLFWIATNDNDQLFAAVGTVNGTTISYGANTAIGGYDYVTVRSVRASYDSESDAVVVAYRFTQRNAPTQARWRVQGMTISGTTISVNSTAHESGSDILYDLRLVCDNKGGFGITKVQTNQTWHVLAGTVSTAGAISVGSESHIANSIGAAYNVGIAIGYDPVNDKYITLGRYTNNNVHFGVYSRSANGTTINNHTLNGSPNSWIASVSNGESFDVKWDDVNSKFIVIYENNVSNNLRYRFGKITAAQNALSNVGEADLFTSARQDVLGKMAYDKATGHAFWLYADSDGNNTKLLTVTIAGGTGTTASATAETIASYKEELGLVVGCNGSGLVFTGIDKSDNSDIDTRAKQFQVTTSNLTALTFVGFSDAAYSDGNTATIKVVGNTTTQSGLTPSKTYYVQKAGTLSAGADDPSVIAGIALTPTSLLIKG